MDKKCLSMKQKKAIPFIINSKNYDEGCKNAEISRSVFYEWLQNPIFKDELARIQDEVARNAIQILKANVTRAAEVLVSLLDHKENPILLRTVCNDIIGHVIKFREAEEIEKRLENLETKVNMNK